MASFVGGRRIAGLKRLITSPPRIPFVRQLRPSPIPHHPGPKQKPTRNFKKRDEHNSIWNSTTVKVLGGLATVGLGVLCGYSLNNKKDKKSEFDDWPQYIQKWLHDGIAAKRKGDFATSRIPLRRVWDFMKLAQEGPITEARRLRTVGVGIALGDVLESNGQLQDAYEVYQDTLRLLPLHLSNPASASLSSIKMKIEKWGDTFTLAPELLDDHSLQEFGSFFDNVLDYTKVQSKQYRRALLSPEETLRGIALAERLGKLSERRSASPDEALKWFMLSTKLSLGLWEPHSKREYRPYYPIRLIQEDIQLDLPEWVAVKDLSASLMSLTRCMMGISEDFYHGGATLAAIVQYMIRKEGPRQYTNDECNTLAETFDVMFNYHFKIPGKDLKDAFLASENAIAWCEKCNGKGKAVRSLYPRSLFNHAEVLQCAGMIKEANWYYEQARAEAVKVGEFRVVRDVDGVLQVPQPEPEERPKPKPGIPNHYSRSWINTLIDMGLF